LPRRAQGRREGRPGARPRILRADRPQGGETVKAERGHEFYEQIGKKGGESVRASRGPEFYSQIGHKGGQKVRELIEQGKRMAREAAQKEAGLDEMGNLKGGGREEK